MKLKLLNILVFAILSCFVSCGSEEDKGFSLDVTEAELRDRIMNYLFNKRITPHYGHISYVRTTNVINYSKLEFESISQGKDPDTWFKDNFPNAGNFKGGKWDFIKQQIIIEMISSNDNKTSETRCTFIMKESLAEEDKEQLFNLYTSCMQTTGQGPATQIDLKLRGKETIFSTILADY